MTVVQGSQYEAGSGPGLSGLSSDCGDAHYLSGVLVNDGPVSQWVSKVDLNSILAVIATSERSGEGHHPNPYVDIRLPQRHSRGAVAGGDTEFEPLRGKQHHFHYPHLAAPGTPTDVMPDHETGHENQQPGHGNCDDQGPETAGQEPS